MPPMRPDLPIRGLQHGFSTTYVVVVFPLVPVTPTMRERSRRTSTKSAAHHSQRRPGILHTDTRRRSDLERGDHDDGRSPRLTTRSRNSWPSTASLHGHKERT